MNDVDVSLRELRDLEERRIADEEAARNAELAARAAEQAARAAAEEAAMLARRRQLEEDAIRVREVEARARAEALVRIESDRLASEVELRRAELAVRRPRWMIGLAAGLAAISLLTGGLALNARDENQRRAAELRDARGRIDDATRRLDQARAEEVELRKNVATYREELEKMRTAAAELQKRLAEATRKVKPEPGKKPTPRPQPAIQDVNTIQVCTDKVLCD